MRWARIYYAGSVLVAMALVFNTTHLLFGPPHAIDLAASLAELLWIPVSLVTVAAFWRAGLPVGVPVSFLAYALASWIHSFYLVGRGTSPAHLQLSVWLVAAVDLFAAAYAVASVRALRRLGPGGR